jgi:hypothetical protein
MSLLDDAKEAVSLEGKSGSEQKADGSYWLGAYHSDTTDVLTTGGRQGWGVGPDGYKGFERNLQLLKKRMGWGHGPLSFGAEASGPDVGINLSSNDSVTQVGAQANLASVALSHENSNSDSSWDSSFKLGASEGIGAGLRLHHGDKDKDGAKEYGFGYDFGPVSFDYKTEKPWMLPLLCAGPLGLGALGAMHGVNTLVDVKQAFDAPKMASSGVDFSELFAHYKK